MFTKAEIRDQLERMGVPRDRVVLVHSSLRAVGEVEGRGEGLLDVLIDHCTAQGGLLCIPTHTWAFGSREFPLDMTVPETCIGTLPNLAARDARGVRTSHPSHSMAVFGDSARVAAFVAGEEKSVTPCHPDGCYGKICDMDGCILLVGVGHNRNTYLHCVEEILDMPNRLSAEPHEAVVKLATGEQITQRVRTHKTDFTSDVSLRFPKYETAFRYHGAIVDGFVGNAPTQCCDARIMKETMEKIWKNCNGVDPLIDEKDLPPKWYC